MVGERVKASSGGGPKVQIMLKTGVKTPVRVRFPQSNAFVPEADIGPVRVTA
jgi:hypothetical protein